MKIGADLFKNFKGKYYINCASIADMKFFTRKKSE